MTNRQVLITALELVGANTHGCLDAWMQPEEFSNEDWDKITEKMHEIATGLMVRANRLKERTAKKGK